MRLSIDRPFLFSPRPPTAMPLLTTRLAATAAICLTSACAVGNGPSRARTPPETEEPLYVQVDDLDVRHGSLRIEATMLEGSADVSMWLGPKCPAREVGRGFATPAGFAWSLSGDEVADAIECSLVVRARTVDDDGRYVRKVAPLPVSIDLVDDRVQTVRLFGQDSRGSSTRLIFATPTLASRLHIGGSIIGAEDEEEDEDASGDGSYRSAFDVGNDDLARSMLQRRRISILGEHFLATITVGSMTLEVATPAEEDVTVEEVGDG